MLVSALLISLGFLVGFSVGQGSTCAVSAAKEVFEERRAHLLAGFALAAGVAGLICLPLSWSLMGPVHLAGEMAIGLPLFAGAALLGLGAVVNDACLFGTLSRISKGEVRFLAVPVGLALGFAVADVAGLRGAGSGSPNRLGQPSIVGYAAVAGFGLLFGFAWLSLKRAGDAAAPDRWSLRTAMIVLGIGGALLFAIEPGWTYADELKRDVAIRPLMVMLGAGAIGWTGTAVAVATLAAASAAGFVARHFRFSRPDARGIARSFVGGAVMGIGSVLVPGGNDTLLLWSLPAATMSGILAYAIMTAVVFVLMAILHRGSLRPAIRGR